MKIPPEIISKYPVADADTAVFLDIYDEPIGDILEIGCHDEPIANILAQMGNGVMGVDLRESDDIGQTSYYYRRCDFCNPDATETRWDGGYDVVIAISCIEHFGLGTYEEGKYHAYYDVIAMRRIWSLLKEGGVAYISVPYGKEFSIVYPHWRIYDRLALQERLIQDFALSYAIGFVADKCEINGVEKKFGDQITLEDADTYSGDPPHISCLMKLIKIPVNRIAPDGR